MPSHSRRPRHLIDEKGRTEVTLESGHVVTSAPGYVIFIDSLHNGRWQTVTIDPEHVAGLTHALQEARDARR